MNTYQFTLVLSGVDENTPELEDQLYVHCDDALINFRNGTVYLDFDREAANFEKTIIAAIKDIESTSLGACVVHVAPDDWVSEAEIAKRLEISRQRVSLWVKGARRKEPPFPKPILKLSEKSPLWRWSEITKWLYAHEIISDKTIVDFAIFIESINSALEEREKKEIGRLRHEILEKLAA